MKFPAMKNIDRFTMPVIAVFVCNLIIACTPSPSKSDISEAIRRYFESQGYGIEELVISDISSQPISELKYMGTKGYHVGIQRLTLVIEKKSGDVRTFRKGDRVTLHDGVIIVREDPSRRGKWIVSSISSNLAP